MSLVHMSLMHWTLFLHYVIRSDQLKEKSVRVQSRPWDFEEMLNMLQFDRDVFEMVPTTTEEEMRMWFQAHVVWTKREDVLNLLSCGVMHRITYPKISIQNLRQARVFKNAMSKISWYWGQVWDFNIQGFVAEFQKNRKGIQQFCSLIYKNHYGSVAQW